MGTWREHRRQKALAKRKVKRKKARETSPAFLSRFPVVDILAVAQAPIYECKVPANLFEMGIGNVVFSRQLPSGQIAASVFLLDVYCLGVKNAFYSIVDVAEFKNLIDKISYDYPLQEIHPAGVRKLIEGGVAYARQFGLNPHADYLTAAKLFGDVDALSCPVTYEFGHEGKPFYISGPNDTPARIRQIVDLLEQKCGLDGFDYQISN